MTPTDDPDIVPTTDSANCGSSFLYTPVGFGCDVDHLMTYPWDDTPDTLDTDGDPE